MMIRIAADKLSNRAFSFYSSSSFCCLALRLVIEGSVLELVSIFDYVRCLARVDGSEGC